MKKLIKRTNRIISSFLAAVMTMAVFAAIPATAQTGITTYNNGYTVEYNVLNEWDGHQAVDVKIINTGTEPILNWALKYDAGGEVTGLWNGVIYENDGTEYIIKNAGYNYEVAPNTSVNFGYTLVGDNPALPGNFEIYSKRVDISEGYDVQLIETNNWGAGFQGEIILTNTSDVPLEAWTFTFDSNFVIDNLWSGRILETQGNTYTVASEMWTNPIMPGASVSFGFTASMDNGTIPAILNCIMSVVQIGEGNDIPIDPDPEITITAEADYDPETGLITVNWETSEPEGIFEILVSYDEENFIVSRTVINDVTYSFEPEEFELLYVKVRQTDGERTAESEVCPVVNTTEEIDWNDSTDSDEDGIPDVYEIHVYKTDPNNSDTDSDGLPDGYEIFILDTDPAEADTDDNGINDGEEDFDGDGLINSAEFTNGTDPFNPDTDDDTINDYDEIYTYNTDPFNPDTDDDNVSDSDEIILGLDPNNPETYDYPDSEYTVEQTVNADSESLSEINDIGDNPFTVTVDINAAGVADNNLYAKKSGYSNAVENPAIIGVVPELVYSGGLKTEGITINFNLDNSITGNTLGTYASDPEFVGIKRLNIFRFFEDVNMLLPVETLYDEANNRVYTNVNELGTYCLMDMELLLDNLGIEPESSAEPEAMAMTMTMTEPVMPINTPSLRESAPIDVIFVTYVLQGMSDVINPRIIELSKEILDEQNNVRIHYVAPITFMDAFVMNFSENSYAYAKINEDGEKIRTSDEELEEVLGRIPVVPMSSIIEPNFRLSTTLNYTLRNVVGNLQSGSNRQCFIIDGVTAPYLTGVPAAVTELKANNIDLRFISYNGCVNNNSYMSYATDGSLHTAPGMDFRDFVLSFIKPAGYEYPIITATGYRFVELDAPVTEDYLRARIGELDIDEPTEKFPDTDGDELMDFEELLYGSREVPYINWDDDGNAVLFTYGEILEFPEVTRFYIESGNPDPFGEKGINPAFEEFKRYRVLPIVSDPSSSDIDGDGLQDGKGKYIDGKVIVPKDPAPLKWNGPENANELWDNQLSMQLSGEYQTQYAPENILDGFFESFFSSIDWENNLDVIWSLLFTVQELDSEHPEEALALIEAVTQNEFTQFIKDTDLGTNVGAAFLRFRYSLDETTLHARPDRDYNQWQYYCGYFNFYDAVFQRGTDALKKKIYFDHGGEEYVLWGWKADYMNLGLGSEFGIYRTVKEEEYDLLNGKHFEEFTMPDDNRLMTNSTYYQGNNIVNWQPENPIWWATAFVPAYKNVTDVENMTIYGTIDFSSNENDKAMYESFKFSEDINSIDEKSGLLMRDYLIFDDDNYIVWFMWWGV